MTILAVRLANCVSAFFHQVRCRFFLKRHGSSLKNCDLPSTRKTLSVSFEYVHWLLRGCNDRPTVSRGASMRLSCNVYRQHYFYNMVHPSEVQNYIRRSNEDEGSYLAAQQNNPDPSWCVLLVCFYFTIAKC